MIRFARNVAPIALLGLAFAMPAVGQDLFEQQESRKADAPLTEAQKAAGEKESIF